MMRPAAKVEVFLNDTNGGSFRGDVYGTMARAKAYREARVAHRDVRIPMMDGYAHGDVVCKSMLEFLRADDDYMTLAWHAVVCANRDDRPNGRDERSFSEGDVLRVTKRDGTVVWLASTGYDLVEIDAPARVYEYEGVA